MEQRTHSYISISKVAISVFVDFSIIVACYLIGFFAAKDTINLNTFIFVLSVAFVQIIVSSICGVYKTITRNFGMTEALKFCTIITLCNTVVFFIHRFAIKETFIGNTTVFIYLLIDSIEMVLVVFSRSLPRLFYYFSVSKKNAVPTMIIGAGAVGKIAFDEIKRSKGMDNKVVCFLDKDSEKIGRSYLGKPVVGPMDQTHYYVEKYNIKEVIIAISNISKNELQAIIASLSKDNVKIRRMPLLSEINEYSEPLQIKELSLAELLGRAQIIFNTDEIEKFLKGNTVLITGGGGSIGSELARQCYDFKVKTLILFDIYENALYDIQQELVRRISKDNSEMELITLIGSTYNEFRVEEIFNKYKPDIVLHAAAYKHVPLMEQSPAEAIRTNCIGTYNVAKMCEKYKVKKMVLVSTDKAVRPTNTMGATKSFAEMIIRYFAKNSKETSFSAVRFGNVLGSNGSVIPLFQKQIKEGGPVTVTHKEITRYFMTIPEAVSLILQSSVYATGGEIFILDMGEPIKIVTLAENVIKQSGLIPYKDIDIVFTGLRPGEKLYEELLIDPRQNQKTNNEKIFIEEPKKIYPIDEEIESLSKVFKMTDTEAIKKVLQSVVTSYTDYKEHNAKEEAKRKVSV